MKKRLLFVIESLEIGGAERSLINLLNRIDTTRYEVDLQLFSEKNRMMPLLERSEINVLPLPDYFRYLNSGLLSPFESTRKIKHIFRRGLYSLYLRLRKKATNSEQKMVFWQLQGQCIERNPKVYDVAIAYSQGLPTFYVADKVDAKLKIAWVNVEYELSGKQFDFNRRYYEKFNHIVGVSDKVRNHFTNVLFPGLKKDVAVIRDIIDPEEIIKKSEEKIPEMKTNGETLIVGVGRYNYQKGWPYAIDTAKVLKDRGIPFRWLAVGDGPLREQLQEQIDRLGLSDRFMLTGAQENPYPYIKACDIYVQTSLMEGFGLTIAEAKILGKPIVATNFNAVTLQIEDGVNGLISDFIPEEIADRIELLINDVKLRDRLIANLSREDAGNSAEIEKFYQLLNG